MTFLRSAEELELLEFPPARVRSIDRSSAVVHELSPRELEILSLMADGWTNAGICEALFLSARTVETHVRRIFIKLCLPPGGAEHRRVAAVLAYQQAHLRRERHDSAFDARQGTSRVRSAGV